eukprot:3570131-Prymnesium_polylepis.1
MARQAARVHHSIVELERGEAVGEIRCQEGSRCLNRREGQLDADGCRRLAQPADAPVDVARVVPRHRTRLVADHAGERGGRRAGDVVNDVATARERLGDGEELRPVRLAPPVRRPDQDAQWRRHGPRRV